MGISEQQLAVEGLNGLQRSMRADFRINPLGW
jgi:hypothetical protein